MVIDTLNITPQDFEPNAERWTPGMLRHLIAVVGRTPIVVTINRQSGQTMIGSTIVGLTMTKGRFYLDLNHGGHTDRTWVQDLGEVIVPLGKSEAKWDTARAFKAERDAALAWIRTRHPQTESGELVAVVGVDAVSVLHSVDGRLAESWTVSLALLQAPAA